MSEIKVNTDDLRNNAAAFNAEAQNLNATLAELLSVLNALDLGKYQSQLSDRVSLRVSPTQDRISIYQQDFQDLAEKLYKKADEFEQANTDSMSNVAQLSNQMYEFTNRSGTMAASAMLYQINTKKANIIWGFVGTVFGDYSNWLTLFPNLSGINRYLLINQIKLDAKNDIQHITESTQAFVYLEGDRKPLDYKNSENHRVVQEWPLYHDGTTHPGVDFMRLRGDDSQYQIYPIGPGVVSDVGKVPGYGNYVMIQHKVLNTETSEINTIYSYYAHLAEKPDLEKLDSNIQINITDPIGIMGNSGTKDIHLHLEVRKKEIPVGRVTWKSPDETHEIETDSTVIEVLKRDYYNPEVFYKEDSKYIFIPFKYWQFLDLFIE